MWRLMYPSPLKEDTSHLAGLWEMYVAAAFSPCWKPQPAGYQESRGILPQQQELSVCRFTGVPRNHSIHSRIYSIRKTQITFTFFSQRSREGFFDCRRPLERPPVAWPPLCTRNAPHPVIQFSSDRVSRFFSKHLPGFIWSSAKTEPYVVSPSDRWRTPPLLAPSFRKKEKRAPLQCRLNPCHCRCWLCTTSSVNQTRIVICRQELRHIRLYTSVQY